VHPKSSRTGFICSAKLLKQQLCVQCFHDCAAELKRRFVFTFTVAFANNRNITIKSPTNVKRQEALSQSFLGWPID